MRRLLIAGAALSVLLTGCPSEKQKPARKHPKPSTYHGHKRYKCGERHPHDVMVRCEYNKIYEGEPSGVLLRWLPRVAEDKSGDGMTQWIAGDRDGTYVVVWNYEGSPTTVDSKSFYPAPPHR